ncbi:MAG: hypothetical protein P8Z49_08030 [Acidobacteriota bacterium]
MPKLNPAELEIDLFCKGVRIGEGCTLEKDARSFSRTRAGLGSGLEIILPSPHKDIWMNAPVFEPFVESTPYKLVKRDGEYLVEDTRNGAGVYPVRVPSRPSWYDEQTSTGVPMNQVGVLQGTYLGIYFGETCHFWRMSPSKACKFCTTGLNVGTNEALEKSVDDVVETALKAKEESGITFVHFNSGYQENRSLEIAAPYVKALKEKVGVLVGLQAIPSAELWKYDWLIDLGVDHFSFCYEFHNPKYFEEHLPGKQEFVGQQTFFSAMEYVAKKMGKGRNSGEIIAGIEPVEDTLKAIEYITSVGCFPTVCIFRPLHGASLSGLPSPPYEDMVRVFRAVYESCMKAGIPTGLAPNIEVSLIVNPDDASPLSPPSLKNSLYEFRSNLTRIAARPLFASKMRRRRIKADAYDSSGYCPSHGKKPATA